MEKGAFAYPENDTIKVDGKPVETARPLEYLIAYKPRGLVSTRHDEQGRPTVMELLPRDRLHLYPVGRLDVNSEGLLIFTNDGDFAQALLAPRNRIERVYIVKVRNVPDAKTLSKMRSGITLDGERLAAQSVSMLDKTKVNAWLKIVLTEGRKHHIRNLCKALGHPVVKLKRVSIGPVTLGGMKPNEVRHLPVETVNKIKKMAGLHWKKKSK